MDWSSLKAFVEAEQKVHKCIAVVSHPNAVGEVLTTERGNVRIVVGKAFYQYSTGEVVEI